jgi:hypothetical protein
MAKNNWDGGDLGTKYNMNQPLWLVSGEIEGGAHLRVYVGPGFMRFPNRTQVVGSGQMTSFLINNVQANKELTIFVRSDGRFIVSGTGTPGVTPDCPRWDGTPLGTIATGTSIATGNLSGPWNGGVDSVSEERGMASATAVTRDRIIYDQRAANAWVTAPANAQGSIGEIGSLTYSGISFLTFYTFKSPGAVDLSATICWIPSGQANTTMNWQIVRAIDDTTLVEVRDEHWQSTGNINPDAAGNNLMVTTLQAIDTVGSGTGYSLQGILSAPTVERVRINSVYFRAVPGLIASNLNEPDD